MCYVCNHCNKCGREDLKHRCSKCGAMIEPGVARCKSCGNPVPLPPGAPLSPSDA